MITAATVKDSLETGRSLGLIAEVYTELASSRLQQIRATIERNRVFATELAQVFHAVKTSSNLSALPQVARKGQIDILITSNHPLYGNIESRLVRFFIAHSQLTSADTLVIGRIGQEYLHSSGAYKRPYDEKILVQDLPNGDEVNFLASKVLSYERVMVYHSTFQSIVVQNPAVTDISVSAANVGQAATAGETYYIFEPEIDKMIAFFDGQILRILLEQTFLESELARTASRLIAMDEAQHNAADFLAEQMRLQTRISRLINQEKILEMSLQYLAKRNEQ